MTQRSPNIDRDRLVSLLQEDLDLSVEAGGVFADARRAARELAARLAPESLADVDAALRLDEDPAIAAIVEDIAIWVRGGRSLEQIAERLEGLHGPATAQAALQQYHTVASRVRVIREPGGAIDPNSEPWYVGPLQVDQFWGTYRQKLIERGWPAPEVQRLDHASTKIVALLGPPTSEYITTRGLVVGYIQSGKTANYAAVITKAADAGYRLFIVLSGLTNALRSQTQRRLHDEIVAPRSENWIELTEEQADFQPIPSVDALLSAHSNIKVLAVVKKNAHVLRRLRDWLTGARPDVLSACPVLVIDDEADQASPNAAADTEQRTAINALLVDLLGGLPKAAYVGYTATPFANLLIDPLTPADLYPRDFILHLPKPDGYFGPERIFGRDVVQWDHDDQPVAGLDMLRRVPSEEISDLRPAGRDQRAGFRARVTPTLEHAIRQFILATAARRVREGQTQHSTMLIHTSLYQDVHASTCNAVEDYVAALRRRLIRGDETLLNELREQWTRESDRVPASTFGLDPVPFDNVASNLLEAASDIEVRVENALSNQRIDYAAGTPRTYIVIGGNVLSRGLTLEGLTISYFLRTASAYDTLLQMGRWFGFRRGYEDLPRVWMTDELRGFFYDLASVEREIRIDIDRYKTGHITPADLGVRIREHPKLAITAKLKMRHAVRASMSFSGKTVQTTVFKHQDELWLSQNIAATRTLVRACLEAAGEPETLFGRSHRVFFDVPAQPIFDFLRQYRIHETHLDMRPDLIADYIKDQIAVGELRYWNVAIATRDQRNDLGTIDLGLGTPVALINRSRFLRGDLEHASIKALISEIDEAADVARPTEELRGLSRDKLREVRQEEFSDEGLLLIYPISRNSVPTGDRDELRRPLNAVADVIGLALVFPTATRDTPQNYMTVNLANEPREALDSEELRQIEEVA